MLMTYLQPVPGKMEDTLIITLSELKYCIKILQFYLVTRFQWPVTFHFLHVFSHFFKVKTFPNHDYHSSTGSDQLKLFFSFLKFFSVCIYFASAKRIDIKIVKRLKKEERKIVFYDTCEILL